MKHNIEKPNLTALYNAKNQEDRREERYLAFEAEFDINRPFEVEWSDEDKYLIYEGYVYFYKPQYGDLTIEKIQHLLDGKHRSAVYSCETPHFFEYRIM